MDLVAERGSSPERLSTPETLRGEVTVDASSDIVMVYDRELDRYVDEDEVFGDQVSTPPPVLTSSSNTTSPNTTPGSEQEDEVRQIKFTGGLENDRLVEDVEGGLVVTRVLTNEEETRDERKIVAQLW